jgi:hypothetical protein
MKSPGRSPDKKFLTEAFYFPLMANLQREKMTAVQTNNKAYTLSISGLIPKVPWPIPKR